MCQIIINHKPATNNEPSCLSSGLKGDKYHYCKQRRKTKLNIQISSYKNWFFIRVEVGESQNNWGWKGYFEIIQSRRGRQEVTRAVARCVLKVHGWRIHNLSTQPVPGFIQKNKKEDGFWCVFTRSERICCIPVCSVIPGEILVVFTPSQQEFLHIHTPGVFSLQSQTLLTPKMLLQSFLQTLCSKSTFFFALRSPDLDPALQMWPQQRGAGGFSEN